MKRVLAFILLLCHMNGSMFLPQMPEDDVYDKSGNQLDDINSILEYVRVELGYDKTADDEDDDSGQNFHLVNAVDYYYEQKEVILQLTPFSILNNQVYSEYLNTKISSVSFDIITPPPEA